jgi:hypothetical protein
LSVANEVKIKVTAENATGPTFAAIAGSLRTLSSQAESASRSTEELSSSTRALRGDLGALGAGAESASRGASGLSRSTRSLHGDLGDLDRTVLTSRSTLRMLARAFDETEDSARRMDIGRAMERVQADISAGSRRRFRLSDLLNPDPQPAAGNFIKKLGSALSGAASNLSSSISNPVGLALGVGIGLAAGPPLASTLAATVAAGAGAAVIGGGIALAVKNSTGIQAAGKEVGTKFMKALGEGAKAYELPIAQSLGILSDAGTRVAARLSDAFSATSSSVVPLVRDITQGVEGFVDVIAGIAEKSGPALAGLGDAFRLIMDGLGDGLESMVGDGESLGETLTVVGGVLGDLIRKTGEFVGWLDKLTDNPWISIMPLLKAHYQDAADATDTMAGSTAKLASELTNAQKAAEGQLGAMTALSDELRAQTDPVFGLLKAQEDLKAAQKRTADATKEHGKNSNQAKDALRDQARAALDLESNVGKLGSTFNGTMTPALRNTLKAAGLTDSAINSLEGQFREAKSAAGAFAGNYKANVSAPGAKAATQSLYTVRDAANSIPRAVSIAMRITGVTNVSKQAAAIRKAYAHGGITGAAASGGIRTDEETLVGENGPELLRLPPSTMVSSAADTKRKLGDNARWLPAFGKPRPEHDKFKIPKSPMEEILDRYGKGLIPGRKTPSYGGGDYDPGSGSGPLEITFKWEPSGNKFRDALAQEIRVYVKNTTGGNVQEALGSGRPARAT